MLQLTAALLNRPVMSLRVGAQVATTEKAIINPNNLKVEGLYCIDKFSSDRLVLLAQDIRNVVQQGVIVNDHEVLTDPDELIRLKSVLEIDFDLLGKLVQTESKRKLGKIVDFATDDQNLFVQKLYISQSLIKSIGSTQLSIDRTQVVEITDKRIIVKDLENRGKVNAPSPAPAV